MEIEEEQTEFKILFDMEKKSDCIK